MKSLTITTCQSPNAEASVRDIAAYLQDRLELPTRFIADIPWQLRLSQFDRGQIHIAWLCGLPYIQRSGHANPPLDLIAAPVMLSGRYQNKPIYFSDVVVQADSHFSSFLDLRAAAWAYNEPTSHSGYNITRCHLAAIGQPTGFFGRVLEADSHENALQMLLTGQIDAAAIDSTVLDTELFHHPHYAERIRVIETLGPSPIPPYVAHTSLPQDLRHTLRQVLTNMHQDPVGQRVLSRHRMLRFAPVTDADYDPIRRMLATADKAGAAL